MLIGNKVYLRSFANLALVMVICAGCTATSSETPVTQIVTLTIQPTAAAATSSPVSEPTATPAPTSISTPSFPVIRNFPGADEEVVPFTQVFLGGFTTDCVLPCWYDLHMHQSGLDNVEQAFRTAFEFSDEAGSDDNLLSAPEYWWFNDPIDGYEVTGYGWQFSAEPDGFLVLSVGAFVDETSHDLEGIVFFWAGWDQLPEIDFSIPQVVQALGPPDRIYANSQGFPSIPHLILFVYDQGLAFAIQGGVTFRDGSPELCLDDLHSQSYDFGRLIITSPLLIDRLENDTLTALEEIYLRDEIENGLMSPLNEIMDVSLEEIMKSLTTQGQNTCLPIPLMN